MHWADINAALYKKGYSPMKVSRELGITDSGVTQVIRGQQSSYNIASFISSVTGIPLKKLFPDGRYDQPGKRIVRKKKARKGDTA